MEELKILEDISNVPGKKEKRAILENNKDNEKLGQLLNAALNFFRKYHIAKWDDISPTSETPLLNGHTMLMELLSKLEKRELTGNAAKSAVENFMGQCNTYQQEWYSKVLKKDLKIGVSVDTAAKYFDIPTFDVMLATDGKKCKKIDEIISKGVYASPKLDGYRCFAIIRDGEATLYSRNGSVYKNFPSIKASLEKLASDPSIGDLILDGEIMSDDFQSMQQSAFASKRGTTVGDVKFFIFDTLDLREWDSNKFKESKSDRVSRLNNIALDFDDNLLLVDQDLVTDKQQVLDLEVQYMALGYEGVMIVPNIPYYKGRKSNKLMKFKTMKSQDCEIVGFYEGTQGTKHEGRMGGIVVKQENGLQCECGSGFSDDDRDYMWNNKDEFLGRKVEIKYQELTNHDIMRFPIFMRFRDDK